MTLLFSVVRDLTLQQMQGKCASEFSSLPKLHISLLEVGWSKEKAKLQNMPWWGTTYKIWVTQENHSRNNSYLYVLKNIQKPKFLSRDRVRRFDSKLFCFSIAQDILVDTWKFIGSSEARNNLYADFHIKEMNPLSPLNFTRGREKD